MNKGPEFQIQQGARGNKIITKKAGRRFGLKMLISTKLK